MGIRRPVFNSFYQRREATPQEVKCGAAAGRWQGRNPSRVASVVDKLRSLLKRFLAALLGLARMCVRSRNRDMVDCKEKERIVILT
jgi:hypothetical protein